MELEEKIAHGIDLLIAKLKKEISDKDTLIESQKAEIERLQMEIDDLEMQGIIDIEMDEYHQ